MLYKGSSLQVGFNHGIVFLISLLLFQIFSIWLAHALESGIDSKNNKNPYTVICFSLHVTYQKDRNKTLRKKKDW
jgi:hypothetical protein